MIEKFPSYYDLMRAFMALRDGEPIHDLTNATGLEEGDEDYQRIVDCEKRLHDLWILSLENEEKAKRMSRLVIKDD